MQQTLIDDRYVVRDLLGSGGMAEVYRARDEVLGRDVALKVLRGGCGGGEEFVGRFKREARSAAALSHPNIVPVYDQGRSEDGTHYIAMECVTGGTLKERILERGPLPPGEAVGISLHISRALAAAHRRGIVHHDIKPRNILLTESGVPKVADFGIARAAGSSGVSGSCTGQVFGTAKYMSPEQARGEPASPGSDLYSLGVVLYEMLTGEAPFDDPNPLLLAEMHLEEPPRAPSETAPEIPGELDALVLVLLSKSPASAAELAGRLERLLAGLSPATGGPTQDPVPETRGHRDPGGRLRGKARRRRGRAALALAAGIVLLGGLGWAALGGSGEGEVVGTFRDEVRETTREGGAGDEPRPPVEVPGLSGLMLDEAEAELSRSGLEPGARTETASGTASPGVVTAQDPSPGTEVETGATVDLVVVAGGGGEVIGPGATPESPVHDQYGTGHTLLLHGGDGSMR